MAKIQWHFSCKKYFEILKNAVRFHVHVSWIITSQEPLKLWVLSVNGFSRIWRYVSSFTFVQAIMWQWLQPTCCSSSSIPSSVLPIKLNLWLNDLTEKMCTSVSGSCAYSTEFDCIKFYLRSSSNVTVTMNPAITTCCSSSSTTSSYYKAYFMTKRFNRKNARRFRFRFVCAYSTEFDCIKFYLRSSNNVTVTMAPAVTTCCSSSSTTSVVIITSKIGNEARTRITSLYSSSVNFLKRDRRSSSWKQTNIQNYFPFFFCSKWNFYLHDKNFRLRHFWAHRVHFITSGETWDIKIRILMMTYVTFLVQLYL